MTETCPTCLELQASNVRLRNALKYRDGGDHDSHCKVNYGRGCNCGHIKADEVLSETPAQSLEHIQANAIDGLIRDYSLHGAIDHDDAIALRDKLRGESDE